MHINSAEIANYKCFLNQTKLEFHPNFNILLGKNNSGKTTILEALSGEIKRKPHFKHTDRSVTSSINYNVAVGKDEFWRYFESHTFKDYSINIPNINGPDIF